MKLTKEALLKIEPKAARVDEYLPFLNAAMSEFHIINFDRITAFLAQILHESGKFQYMRELWGPTEQQKKYEGRKALGNIEPGDGLRFKGRGAIQLTGRSNYQQYGNLLGIDLINNPQLAENKEHCFRIAACFWDKHGLNQLADKGEFEMITRIINGGLNGQAERLDYYQKARKYLV